MPRLVTFLFGSLRVDHLFKFGLVYVGLRYVPVYRTADIHTCRLFSSILRLHVSRFTRCLVVWLVPRYGSPRTRWLRYLHALVCYFVDRYRLYVGWFVWLVYVGCWVGPHTHTHSSVIYSWFRFWTHTRYSGYG